MTLNTYLLDYGAGNIRSVVNAAQKLGYPLNFISSVADFDRAERIIFPGVGSFGNAIEALSAKGYLQPLRNYILSGRPFMGICIGMQVLFEGSEESQGVEGLGILPGMVKRFSSRDKVVPHMGWNQPFMLKEMKRPCLPKNATTEIGESTEDHQYIETDASTVSYSIDGDRAYYYVHSYAVPFCENLKDWTLCTTQYGSEVFVAAVSRGNVLCTQFHPEKSGDAGLEVLRSFLAADFARTPSDDQVRYLDSRVLPKDLFKKRIIAALDVRTNDEGDLVVTKGDQYDVREKEPSVGDDDERDSTTGKLKGEVRNLGKPVELARRYYEEGVDEICFLNITSFRSCPLEDLPMLEVLRRASETIFVPLTIGGGIKDFRSPDGTLRRAIDVVGEYFRSGADKVSLGSEAVYATERYLESCAAAAAPANIDGDEKNRSFIHDGSSVIEQIAHAYGTQAVVISVDPRRVYVRSLEDAPNHTVVATKFPGPDDERFCWFQCTVAGGREGRDVDVHQLVITCEKLGAGEILLNSMDRDGTNLGYDLELLAEVRAAVTIPVIASSGAGRKEHFSEMFRAVKVDAALAAGIFHRREVPVAAVKDHLDLCGIPIRPIR